MKEFDFTGRTVFTVKWQGEIHKLTCPSISRLKLFYEEIKKEDSQVGYIDSCFPLLAECGLPETISREMEPAQIEALMEYIGSKKK